MQAGEDQLTAAGDPLDGVQRLARFEIEAEPRPLGIDARVEVQTQPYRDLAAELAGDLFQVADFVEMIDVDAGAVGDGPFQRRPRLERSVEDDLFAGYSQSAGLGIFHFGDDLGQGPFLMHHGEIGPR